MTAIFHPSAHLRLDALRCAECGGPGCIIITCETPARAFCSPACAAASGAWPWAGADLVERCRWNEPAPGGIPAHQEV